MKQVVLLFALSLCAAAQTMIGLPQYGVDLTGTIQAPVAVNHSGKTIIAVVIRFYDASGNKLWASQGVFLTEPIVDGGMRTLHGTGKVRFDSSGNEDHVAIDSVGFSNGDFVGADLSNRLGAINQHLIDSAKIAAPMLASYVDQSVWDNLSAAVRHATPDPGQDWIQNHNYFSTAVNLLAVRRRQGDAAAIRAADFISTIPALRKVN